MFLSPPEIQHQKLKSRLGSYDRKDVDELLENVAASYEHVWRERDACRERIAALEQQLRDYQELERPLRDSLVAAQRTAADVKAEAAKHAEALLEDAERTANDIVSRAQREREAIESEIARLEMLEDETAARCRGLLVDALEALGASRQSAPGVTDEGRTPEPAARA